MSLVTTCPACGTRFHVRPKHLSARSGKVRCGHCAQPFDALASLDEIHMPAQEPPLAAACADVAQPSSQGMPAPAAPPPVVGAREPAAPSPPPADLIIAPPAAAAFTPPAPRQGQRFGLFLIVLLLLVGASQLIYHLRTPIATALPAARPLLVQACLQLGCRVELPRRAELLGIEDSDLRQDASRSDAYVLTATLSNRADYAMAYPLLELTLTDINDAPLLRRRLTPAEYLPAGQPADVGIPPGSDIHIRLHFSAEEVKAAGYRVYLTY